jgi:hypothetical protein
MVSRRPPLTVLRFLGTPCRSVSLYYYYCYTLFLPKEARCVCFLGKPWLDFNFKLLDRMHACGQNAGCNLRLAIAKLAKIQSPLAGVLL